MSGRVGGGGAGRARWRGCWQGCGLRKALRCRVRIRHGQLLLLRMLLFDTQEWEALPHSAQNFAELMTCARHVVHVHVVGLDAGDAATVDCTSAAPRGTGGSGCSRSSLVIGSGEDWNTRQVEAGSGRQVEAGSD